MNRVEISVKLKETYYHFADFMVSLSENDFLFSPSPDKWSSGQQAEHLWKSIKPLNLALSLPGWFLRLYVGKANRPSRTYDELVERYNYKLGLGGKATGPYIPKEVPASQQQRIVQKIKDSVDVVCKKLIRYSEEKLDELILPHPLLGKVTIREMMYFTIHHAHHHHESILKNLEARNS